MPGLFTASPIYMTIPNSAYSGPRRGRAFARTARAPLLQVHQQVQDLSLNRASSSADTGSSQTTERLYDHCPCRPPSVCARRPARAGNRRRQANARAPCMSSTRSLDLGWLTRGRRTPRSSRCEVEYRHPRSESCTGPGKIICMSVYGLHLLSPMPEYALAPQCPRRRSGPAGPAPSPCQVGFLQPIHPTTPKSPAGLSSGTTFVYGVQQAGGVLNVWSDPRSPPAGIHSILLTAKEMAEYLMLVALICLRLTFSADVHAARARSSKWQPCGWTVGSAIWPGMGSNRATVLSRSGMPSS